jgi:hypothetical protein
MSAGDSTTYPCSRCPALLTLAELLDHIEAHVMPARGGDPR